MVVVCRLGIRLGHGLWYVVGYWVGANGTAQKKNKIIITTPKVPIEVKRLSFPLRHKCVIYRQKES